MKTEYIVFNAKESVFESFVKDTITFGFLVFCIWVSRGSRAWTLICGIMFLLFLCAKSAAAFGSRTRKFKSREELAEWARQSGDATN